MPTTLDRLIDEYLAELFEDQPVLATSLGITDHDDRLGDHSEEAYRERERRVDRWLERFEAVDDDLSADEAIDRDLVVSHLRGQRILRDWAAWRRSPDTYVGAGLQGVFTLFLHRLRPEPELVTAASARLRQVPEVLDAARRNLDPDLANAELVRRAVGQCRAGIAYSRQLVPAEVEDPEQRRTVSQAGEVAAAAFESFVPFLEGLAERATGPYALGEERYSALLRERELLDLDARELRARGQAAYDELETELQRLARQVGGTEDWRSVVEDVNADHPETPEEMLVEYRAWTKRARAFLDERGLVTFPDGEDCRVQPSPHFQRPMIAVASYSRPPAFTGSRVGHFFVPYPPDGTPPEEVDARLRNNSRAFMPTVTVHEAYPGHHWHLSTMAARSRTLRKVLGSSYFSEGWGLYTEQLMREQGFFTDPREELSQLDARIWRAARIVVDTGLHTGEMDVAEAVRYMSTKASLSEPNARAEVLRYCAWPTQAASYLTGALEIERLRDGWVGAGGELRGFHDAIAATGMLPITLAERALAAGTPH